MNVDDFNIEIPEGDMLETVFNHQRELMNKYHPIEQVIVGRELPSAKGKLGPYDGSLNVQDRQCQLRFKDFAWRITEELTEATLALDEENRTHYLEELIDALHFSVELLIMCGLFPLTSEVAMANPLAGTPSGDSFERSFSGIHPEGNLHTLTYLVIEKLGEAMNRLKLKPWKATAILTDERAFHQSLSEFFAALIDLLKASGFTAKTATQMYLNKNAVNQFRIKSNY
jgi:hypothetical protein